MRTLIVALLIAACLYAPVSSDARSSNDEVRVLFIGNSLTYVGNLPRVLEEVSAASGRAVSAEMIASGGATLTQHLTDPEVRRAIVADSFDFVVLQERGGDLLCAFGPSSCEESRLSLDQLSRLVAETGAEAILLGSYQNTVSASERLVAAEAEEANRLGIHHLPVSGLFQRGREVIPDATWLATDGMHPGADLTLLKSALVFRQLFDSPPSAVAFTVDGDMRDPGRTGVSKRSYAVDRVTDVLGLLDLEAEAGAAR